MFWGPSWWCTPESALDLFDCAVEHGSEQDRWWHVQVAVEMSLIPSTDGALTLPAVLRMHLGYLAMEENAERLLPMLSAEEVASGLLQFAEIIQVKAGDTLYKVGDEADAMYIMLSGEVVCDWDLEAFSQCALEISHCETQSSLDCCQLYWYARMELHPDKGWRKVGTEQPCLLQGNAAAGDNKQWCCHRWRCWRCTAPKTQTSASQA
jgi:hypothetical protein